MTGMQIGRHYEVEKPTARHVTPGAALVPELEDAGWLLGAAMLESLAQDLALTHAAGWWSHDPNEMADMHAEANGLLRELYSPGVQGIFDLIAAATGGRVQVERPWLLRQARWHAKAVLASQATLSLARVCERLRLSQRAGEGNKKYVDLPPSRLPDGRANPAYFTARAAVLKGQGKCRDCRRPLSNHSPRCASCREDNNRRMREWNAKHKEVAA